MIEARSFCEVSGRARAKEIVVIVVALACNAVPFPFRGGLKGDVVEVGLSESSEMKPVVPHPAIHHRAHGRCDLQCRMWVDQSHDNGETLIRTPEHANLAIGFGDILDEPVDGVVSDGVVRGVVGIGRIQRAPQWASHKILAFGAIFAADVLENTDVSAARKHVVARRQNRQHVRRWDTLGTFRRVVRRPSQDDWRILRSPRDDYDGVQFHAIAHRNHDVALNVVIGRGCGLILGRDVGCERRGLGRRLSMDRRRERQKNHRSQRTPE